MWTPHEIRKLIAQIAGLLFGGSGVWLLIDGVQASGTLDITSELLSGKIESGSAGLFLLFLGFLLILFPSFFGSKSIATVSPEQKATQPNSGGLSHEASKTPLSENTKAGIVGVGLVLTSVALLFFSYYLINKLDMNVGIFFGIAGVVSGIIGAIIVLLFLISWISPDAFSDSETNK